MVRFWKKNEKVMNGLKGLLVSYIVSAVLLLVLAFLLYKFRLPKAVIGAGITGVYVISTFIGGFLMGKHAKVKKFMWGLGIGIVYFLILIMISLIVNGGFQNLSGNLFLTMILCGAGGMLGGMLS